MIRRTAVKPMKRRAPVEEELVKNQPMPPMPEGVTEDHLIYLDELRLSGEINMYGARSYLANDFDISANQARTILIYWMATFTRRHPK